MDQQSSCGHASRHTYANACASRCVQAWQSTCAGSESFVCAQAQADMYTDMHAGMLADMHADMCAGTWAGKCAGMRPDMRIDMCAFMRTNPTSAVTSPNSRPARPCCTRGGVYSRVGLARWSSSPARTCFAGQARSACHQFRRSEGRSGRYWRPVHQRAAWPGLGLVRTVRPHRKIEAKRRYSLF